MTPEALAKLPELGAIVGLFQRLVAAEPTLCLELPRLQAGASGRAADVLTMLTHTLDAAVMLPQPDLAIMGAHL